MKFIQGIASEAVTALVIISLQGGTPADVVVAIRGIIVIPIAGGIVATDGTVGGQTESTL